MSQPAEMSYDEALALAARGGDGRRWVWTGEPYGWVRVDQLDSPVKHRAVEMSYDAAMQLKARWQEFVKLENAMLEAARNFDYERAAKLKKELAALGRVTVPKSALTERGHVIIKER